MPRFFDYNPDRGTWIEDEVDDNGNLVFKTWQDVQPVLDKIKERRNSGLVDKGIKNDFWHYATIPAHVELELRQRGINLYNPDQTKELLRVINREYPYLKNTELTHE